jgi:hypothetical protein
VVVDVFVLAMESPLQISVRIRVVLAGLADIWVCVVRIASIFQLDSMLREAAKVVAHIVAILS